VKAVIELLLSFLLGGILRSKAKLTLLVDSSLCGAYRRSSSPSSCWKVLERYGSCCYWDERPKEGEYQGFAASTYIGLYYSMLMSEPLLYVKSE
jgi:hypothetical protein